MELSKNFDFRQSEEKWYGHWTSKGYFSSKPDGREPYTVVIPPPNVTGILHMGHCLNNTIQDILVRRARMQGKNACWVPGTDHASIATEAKVVHMLRERGITKSSLSRDEFLQYAWEWKEKYGGIILQQLRKLGCSLDWDRTTFTMDPEYYASVIGVFNDLYNKGYIYRGKRMINWDPRAKTALSDEEVIFREVQSKLYHIAYDLVDAGGKALPGDPRITIATVRPETILGDTAIAVHPEDPRYAHLKGAFAIVPMIGRRIPIIFDEYVQTDFGTGALKVTPAHDMNDYQLGQKHGLEVVDILNDDGTMSAEAQFHVGEDRFEARKKMVKELEDSGNLVKIEDYTNQVGFSERTDVVVEPRLSLQWWVDMKKISGPALNAVVNDDITFHPAKFKNLYRHWMENIKDWCISRQLWWGHRIPAWYDAEGNVIVAKNEEEARAAYTLKYGKDAVLTQDEDCLDTWFSSWLWPFEVFHGLSRPGNEDVKYYYPTHALVTAPEIIFFWVARMIMAGFEYMGELPFRDVYFTGIVRDKQGRKMSKQLGNSPDLLQMIDEIGADSVRFGILISSPAGNDLLWDESSNEQGRNFTNKIWNALKLIKMWQGREIVLIEPDSQESHNAMNWPNLWFRSRLNEVRAELDLLFSQFRLSEALKTLYSLIWDDYCSWYLEWIKPGAEEPVNGHHLSSAVEFYEELLTLLHPFMPFVSEEIYHALADRATGDDLCVRQLGEADISALQLSGTGSDAFLKQGVLLKSAISGIRDARIKANVKSRERVKLHIKSEEQDTYGTIAPLLAKQVNAGEIFFTDAAVADSITAVIGKDQFYIISEAPIDTSAQKAELVKEIDYLKGFLVSVDKKLGNEKFVANAKPEVVEVERQKKADAEQKIRILQESLTSLG